MNNQQRYSNTQIVKIIEKELGFLNCEISKRRVFKRKRKSF
tara:strand:- start:237 stop:359 length:123 start_codon:yes stop_codon:yes gene_type:complete